MEPSELTAQDAQRPHESGLDEANLDNASQPYVGRWNTLVSTTNWEKGRIINEWRAALVEAGAPPREYADEAWARRVGAVTGQHVGRLRRVYERFGLVYREYPRLYWSHFYAALEWDDAEMYLEGAVQSGWTVAQMRRRRWEAMGAVEGEKPRDGDIVVALLDGGEATLKRYYRESNGIRLQPSNDRYEPIITDAVNIQGVVKGVIRQT
jgi:hypothetical protein